MSGSLLILNFGTFVETNRFKSRAIDGGFLSTDLMQAHPPTGLIKKGGMRTKKTGDGTTYSFYGLSATQWNQAAYRARFKKWITKVISTPVSCVYITGHHGSRFMWWKKQENIKDLFWVNYRTPGKLVFGYDYKGKRVSIPAGSLQKGCHLVLGFGCNIGSADNSAHYQKYFKNGAKKPVVLGWNQRVFVPKRNLPSVNNAFFDYLERFAKTSKRSVPQKGRLQWFYLHEPMELINAWGHAVSPYRNRGANARRLWVQARARGVDGAYYRFSYDKKANQVKPVKI